MVDKSGFSQRPSIYGVGRVRLTWIAGGLLDSNWIMRGGQKSIELCCHWESMQCRRSGWVILGSTVLLAINIPHYQLTIGGKKGGWQARRQTLYSPAGKKVCDTGTLSAPPPTPPRDSCSFSLTEFNSLLGTITVVIVVKVWLSQQFLQIHVNYVQVQNHTFLFNHIDDWFHKPKVSRLLNIKLGTLSIFVWVDRLKICLDRSKSHNEHR